MFLDDDSLFEDPANSVKRLLGEVGADWILLSAVYHENDSEDVSVPRRISLGSAGSGIEWNQVVSRSAFERVGGWNNDFCTGERWKSGGMLDLMIRLQSSGYRQICLSPVEMRHPRQISRSGAASIDKGRRYRFAIGAVLAHNLSRLSLLDLGCWAARLLVLSPINGCLALLKGDRETAIVRIATPWDVVRGFAAFLRSRREV